MNLRFLKNKILKIKLKIILNKMVWIPLHFGTCNLVKINNLNHILMKIFIMRKCKIGI